MGLPVPRWGELARASAHRPQTRANAGRLRGAARRQPPTAGFSAQPRRESSRLGRAARRPLPPRAGRRKFATDRHRRLPRFSRRHSDRLSTRAASALLGPQDAQSSRARAPPRFSRREKQRAGHLSGCRLRCRRPGVSRLPSALAGSLSRSGAQARTGLARVAGLFSDAAAPVAQTAHTPTSSNAASWKCAAAPAPWSASSTNSASNASSTPSSITSTSNGKTAPSAFLHKLLDITFSKLFLHIHPFTCYSSFRYDFLHRQANYLQVVHVDYLDYD